MQVAQMQRIAVWRCFALSDEIPQSECSTNKLFICLASDTF